MGWQTSTSLYTDLALDALKMAIWQRRRESAEYEFSLHPAAGDPPDDTAGEKVHNEGRVAES